MVTGGVERVEQPGGAGRGVHLVGRVERREVHLVSVVVLGSTLK